MVSLNSQNTLETSWVDVKKTNKKIEAVPNKILKDKSFSVSVQSQMK